MPLSASIQARLKHQHESVGELIKGFSEDQLRQNVKEGKWSALQNIAHLSSYQPVFLRRMKAIEQTEAPVFERYRADDDPVFVEQCNWSLKELLDDYSTQRFIINNHLLQLPEPMLRREGVHPVYGRFNICQWADFFLLHEAHHLFTIFMLTASLRTAVTH